MSQAKTVLVTGASGFIAKHICLRLLNAGYAVVGSVRSLERGTEVMDAVRPQLDDDDELEQRLRFVALDLGHGKGWQEAMNGVDILMHTASPFPLVQPDNEAEIIRPAVDGAVRALSAAHAAGVKRVVMTSSSVALMYKQLETGRSHYDENDWSDLDAPATTPYVKSKTLAEQAAWEFIKNTASHMELTTINPGFVLGPPLDGTLGTSLQVVQRLLQAKDPMLPNCGFPTVDVRDIAEMHVRALTTPQSIGKRIIGSDRFLWFTDMATTLAGTYPNRRIVTRRAPNALIRFLAMFDKSIRTIIGDLDIRRDLSNQRAKDLFGMEFIEAEDSVRAAAGYLVENRLAD